ncbi:cytochrome c oxidase subunit 5A, mitochondrial-like [Euwallacea fornicatus]|uniref:cytochrome c oxidase subunit 5A, mitochondrial-like n=1 Tax=Euwallacea fornicatus TaxID=995702 RepID=UPI00338E5DB4
MFRSSAIRIHNLFKNATNVRNVAQPIVCGGTRFMSKHSTETDEQFDQRYEKFFNNPNIDGWDVRSGVTELWGYDLVPEPKIFISILQACRRVNDLALAIRVLEALKDKCGNKVNEIYPWYMEQIKPTLTELGIPTIEEIGYDKPELALECVFDM